MRSTWLSGLFAFCFALAAPAQPHIDPAAVTHLEGSVYVAEKPLLQPGSLPDGSVVRTHEASRVEIRLRGGLLYLDGNSSVRVLEIDRITSTGLR